MSDYLKFRGKCREMSEAAAAADPTLTVVRGYYHCPMWGAQEHWWCTAPDGSIVDPTAAQFPSKGIGEYIAFSGGYPCAECGKEVPEAEVEHAEGRYVFCSYECYGRFVGML